jgi:3-hydroxyacyl-CoA dehydrogenase
VIERAAVIGAGVMGSGIAAHFANAGLPVVLLDVVTPGARDRSELARSAIERARRLQPPPFTTRRAAELVTPGNIEDDLGLLGACDWIVEAIVEDAAAKHGLYALLEAHRKPASVISSNTSTIPLHELLAGAPAGLAPDFLVTHFFNPPRYLRLLEIVAGERTRPEVVDAVTEVADVRLGKTVVRCHDTPGFVANRLGCAWLGWALGEAVARRLSVEHADAVVSAAFDCPKTGVFGLLDLVGIDLVLLVERSFRERLAGGDPFLGIEWPRELLERMVADGRTGRKGDGGFYRLAGDGGRRTKLALDLPSDTYRPAERARPDADAGGRSGLRALVEAPGEGGAYAWAVLSSTLAYAAWLVPEISDSPGEIDRALETGYGWARGPFRLADELGARYLAERLAAEGRPVPPLLELAAGSGGFYASDGRGDERELRHDGERRPLRRPPGVLLLRDVKRRSDPLARNPSASLWDTGDGVLCLELTTKMNAVDPLVLALVEAAADRCADGHRALVLHNEASDFSVGANLAHVLLLANTADWAELDAFGRRGQEVFARLRHVPVPVVGAPSGRALGGGCELLLHCDAIQAHADAALGLVETSVGIVPGWGGCKELLLRQLERAPHGPLAPAQRAFELIALARVSGSAAEARELGFLRSHDRITANRDRLLADARAFALELADGYVPPQPAELRLPGPSGAAALMLAARDQAAAGRAGPHDLAVAAALARVLSGGDCDPLEPVTEADVLALEREAVRGLIRSERTLRRMDHVLATGKPLRN